MGAIENALLDAKAKALGVPCYELLGGKSARPHPGLLVALRDLAHQSSRPSTSRRSPISTASRRSAARCARKASARCKTNIFIYEDGKPRGWRPGFGSPFYPELNVDKTVLRNLRMHLEALRTTGAGPDVDLLLDLNFNAKTEGYLKILRAIADLEMFWVEIDSYSPEALGYIRRQSPHPISSCETLLGLREFLPYFREQAMDVAIIDTPWNGGVAVDEDRRQRRGARGQRRAAQFLRPPVHHDERAFRRRGAEPAHHGDRHRPPALGPRAVHPRAPDRGRPSGDAGSPGWGTEPNEEALRAHPPKNKETGC